VGNNNNNNIYNSITTTTIATTCPYHPAAAYLRFAFEKSTLSTTALVMSAPSKLADTAYACAHNSNVRQYCKHASMTDVLAGNNMWQQCMWHAMLILRIEVEACATTVVQVQAGIC
jgi:hypothetical protein